MLPLGLTNGEVRLAHQLVTQVYCQKMLTLLLEEEHQYSGECSPPRVETPVEDLHSASGVTYEPELKGEETFRDGSVLAPRSNAEPSPQYDGMAAVDNTVDLAPQYATMAAAGNVTYPRSSFPGSESSTRSSQSLAPVTPSYLEKCTRI